MNSYYVDPNYNLQENEKKQIRKTTNIIAAAFLAMSFTMTLWSYPVAEIALKYGFYDVLVKVVKDTSLLNVLQIVISFVAFVVVYWVFGKILKVPFGKALSLKCETTFKQNLGLFLVGAGLCGFANFASSFAGTLFEKMGFSYSANIHHANPTNPFGIALVVLATAVTPAIVEEFALRGVVLNALKPFGKSFAVVISAVLFGLLHGNLEQIPFAFLLGLYTGFITLKTKSIVPAVLLHFYNNLSSVIISFVNDNVTATLSQFLYMFYLLIMFLLGAAGLCVLRKEENSFFSLENDGVLPFKTKILTALLSPVMFVVYLVVIWEAFFLYV